MRGHRNNGFTIVELLIVIVVVAVLAAIVIVAYNGVQARAQDVSIKRDLSNIAKQLRVYEADHGVFPAGSAQLGTIGFKVNKDSYGNPFTYDGSSYNLLYCRMPAVAPTAFALVAFSKSGKNYKYTSDNGLDEYTGAKSGSGPICTAAGVPMSGGSTERDWFYNAGSWQSFVAS